MTNSELEREALRFVAIRASKGGSAAVAQQYAVTGWDIRPEAIPDSAWQNVETKGGDVGFYQEPTLVAGSYAIWAKWVDGTETPVEKAGVLNIL